MNSSLKDRFDERGYVRIDDALAPEGIAGLRRRMDGALAAAGPHPVVKLGDDAEAASLLAGPPLRAAFDALLGPGGWIPPDVLEDVRIKRPAQDRPDWWHVDVFERGPQTQDEDLMSWRAGPGCGGVGLLVLLLLSEVGPADGATALRVGSHGAVAKRLDSAGDEGLSLGELLDLGIDAETAHLPVELTTGPAGTAFLCHPLLVHTALAHTGERPSYWALPPIRRAPSSQAVRTLGSSACS